jgi:AcrR family transcriptional regulator
MYMASPTDRRAELAVAAYEVVAASGIDGLSLRTVARRVGATTGLVSHHFVDRQDLLGAALDHAAETMLARVREVPPGAQPIDVLAAVLPTDEAAAQVWRFSLSVRIASAFRADLRGFDQTIRDYWESSLPARLAGLPGLGADPVEAARHLVALIDGISLGAILDPDGWPADRQLRQLRMAFAGLETGALGAGATSGVER